MTEYSVRKGKVDLMLFRLFFCVCLFVISIDAWALTLLKLMGAHRELDVTIFGIEWVIKTGVLTYFIFKYRESVYYPDVRQFFMKKFFWKYLLAIICSLLVSSLLNLFSFQGVTMSVPTWIYIVLSLICLALFHGLVFYVFVPKQYVFQWKMKLGDIELQEILEHMETAEDKEKIKIGERKIQKIIQEQLDETFTFTKKREVKGELISTYELIWSKDGIQGIYRTPNTLEFLDKAQDQAARYLNKEGIHVAQHDLRYVYES